MINIPTGMNIKITKKGATYSILEQHEDKSKHPDERLTKMIFVTSNNKI